jgi:hypothetical protein
VVQGFEALSWKAPNSREPNWPVWIWKAWTCTGASCFKPDQAGMVHKTFKKGWV